MSSPSPLTSPLGNIASQPPGGPVADAAAPQPERPGGFQSAETSRGPALFALASAAAPERPGGFSSTEASRGPALFAWASRPEQRRGGPFATPWRSGAPSLFAPASDEHKNQACLAKLWNASGPAWPEVRIVGGVPVVTVPGEASPWRLGGREGDGYGFAFRPPGSLPTKDEILNDPRFMTHVVGTYDTYKCLQCDLVTCGYKRGDRGLLEHVWRGDGRCEYVKACYRGRETELLLARGDLRFQLGYLAFPEFLFYSQDRYVKFAGGTERCVVCARSSGQGHHEACRRMVENAELSVACLKAAPTATETFLFAATPGHFLAEYGGFRSRGSHDFGVLGEPANMVYVPCTNDRHRCLSCGTEVQDFVEEDTLLGEHVYHSSNQAYHASGQLYRCAYIRQRFAGREDELLGILGKERYRKGAVAFPRSFAESRCGFASVGGPYRCVVCSAAADGPAKRPPGQEHYPKCRAMKASVQEHLKCVKLLM